MKRQDLSDSFAISILTFTRVDVFVLSAFSCGHFLHGLHDVVFLRATLLSQSATKFVALLTLRGDALKIATRRRFWIYT